MTCAASRMLGAVSAMALVAIPTLASVPGAAAEPVASPDTSSCPYRVTTPPAVDASEVPEPGENPPSPLPVPADTVGGDALSSCGIVVAPNTPPLPQDISAQAWLLADLDTGDVVAAKDPHGRHRPASIIKVLTAMAAIDELSLDKVVMGTVEDANTEGTNVGVNEGGSYTVYQLLHGLLMYSGNDAAHALARQLGGVDAALDKVNTLARQLGSSDTRVATPSGLDGPGMSTSAYDMGLFYRYAWQNPTFAQVVATQTFEFPDTGGNPPYPIENDNRLLSNYSGALGGKTGYTDDAGQTYVGAAERDGRRLLAVLLDGTRQPIPPWQQAAHLLDYGFATPPGTKVGTLVEPDPSLTAQQNGPAANTAAATGIPAAMNELPVRIGVAIAGAAIVFALMLAARSINRRAHF